jgi:kynurenine 3-monooxygenase
MTLRAKNIAIVGAGLVGSLLSIYLRRRGYNITVFERRPDMRLNTVGAGRSINLALSARGIKALEEVGLSDIIREIAIPMHGRMMHDLKGNLSFLPYGKEGQFINSVSRSALNILLMSSAEKEGVQFLFEHRCLDVDINGTRITTSSREGVSTRDFDLIVGADGAFSAVRSAMQVTDRYNYSQQYIDHSYKELHIPASQEGKHQLEKNALHIWPRESFMMIALPNPDGSFTCTLFFPLEGDVSFRSLNTEEKVKVFFETTFPDAVPLMPTLLQDYFTNPTSSLVTVKCFPWVKDKTVLIGDAAHAVVPFYGQGMNAGFEDCRIFNALLNEHDDNLEHVLSTFQKYRKPDADAIAELALENFVEMRDLVADAEFLLRKKIEAKLHQLFPNDWVPLYSMVTFRPDMRYSDAYAIGQKQKAIMDEVMKTKNIEQTWENLDFQSIIEARRS